jgi:hypothetical protein
LTTSASADYPGFLDTAGAYADSFYSEQFTLDTPSNYSFTATSTGTPPTTFYLYDFDTGSLIFDGFSLTGGGALAPGYYGLILETINSVGVNGFSGGFGSNSSALTFEMSISSAAAPTPEPATVVTLASMAAVGLLFCRKRRR